MAFRDSCAWRLSEKARRDGKIKTPGAFIPRKHGGIGIAPLRRNNGRLRALLDASHAERHDPPRFGELEAS
jgi:hypothetical protein